VRVVLVVEGRWLDGSGIVGSVGVGAVGGGSRRVVEAHDDGEAGCAMRKSMMVFPVVVHIRREEGQGGGEGDCQC
jgi:hypothetical protein